jgi:biopolymer transport protein ExbD
MAELNTGGGDSGKHGKKRAKKQSTRVDMTPLVDLAFLLLTFFVLTSTFSQPKVMRMIFPKKLDNPNDKPPEVKKGTTFLLSGNNKVYYYNDKLTPTNPVKETDYTAAGIRAILMERNAPLRIQLQELAKEKEKLNEKDTAAVKKFNDKLEKTRMDDQFVVLIKNDKDATYKNVIDVVDELIITQCGKYFPTDDGFTKEEKEGIDKLKAGGEK